MVRGAGEEGGHARTAEEQGFKGTALVRVEQRPVQTPLRQKIEEARQKALEKHQDEKKPWFQAAVVQYLGNSKWRLGLVPASGDRAQWLEGLPYSEVLTRLEALESRIKRVDHTSKEYRNYS
jgi:hypothetical protein